MSNIIRGFVKARAIPRLAPAAHQWSMNTNQFIQQQRMIVTDDSDEHSEPHPEKETRGSPFGKASEFSMGDRFFRLEENFIQVTRDIGEIKGEIGTMKWQLGVLLAIGLGGSGSVLLYLLKKHFDEPKNESQHKTEMQQALNILESMKSTDPAKKSAPKA